MNIKEYIIYNSDNIDIKKIKIPSLEEEEITLIENYLEFTRHIQEINQLYHIFKINLKDILFHLELKNTDIVTRKADFANEEDDILIINALVINYISSGKTLVESIETFLNNNLEKSQAKEFKDNCLSQIYDRFFSYRLLIRLRDYAQHGHLPVSMSFDGKCSFDLEQILYTPHFNHNKKLHNEMFFIKEKIFDMFKDNPRINFTLSIAEFQICILEIYISFMEAIDDELINLIDGVNNLIIEKPSLIYKSNDDLNGLILYTIKDEYIHAFNPKDNPSKDISNTKDDIKKELRYAKDEYTKLVQSYKNANVRFL